MVPSIGWSMLSWSTEGNLYYLYFVVRFLLVQMILFASSKGWGTSSLSFLSMTTMQTKMWRYLIFGTALNERKMPKLLKVIRKKQSFKAVYQRGEQKIWRPLVFCCTTEVESACWHASAPPFFLVKSCTFSELILRKCWIHKIYGRWFRRPIFLLSFKRSLKG